MYWVLPCASMINLGTAQVILSRPHHTQVAELGFHPRSASGVLTPKPCSTLLLLTPACHSSWHGWVRGKYLPRG